jgi:hypothetical protein
MRMVMGCSSRHTEMHSQYSPSRGQHCSRGAGEQGHTRSCRRMLLCQCKFGDGFAHLIVDDVGEHRPYCACQEHRHEGTVGCPRQRLQLSVQWYYLQPHVALLVHTISL